MFFSSHGRHKKKKLAMNYNSLLAVTLLYYLGSFCKDPVVGYLFFLKSLMVLTPHPRILVKAAYHR